MRTAALQSPPLSSGRPCCPQVRGVVASALGVVAVGEEITVPPVTWLPNKLALVFSGAQFLQARRRPVIERLLQRFVDDLGPTFEVEASDLDMAQFSAPAAPLAAPKWACNGNCIVLTSASGSTARTPYVCVQPLGKHAAAGASGTFMVYSDAALEGLASLVERVRKAQPQGTTKSNMGGWQSPVAYSQTQPHIPAPCPPRPQASLPCSQHPAPRRQPY